MIPVVGVRFKKTGRIYYFDPGDNEISAGEFVIVETSRGVEYGEVVMSSKEVPEEDVVQPLKRVLRIATPEDKIKVEGLEKQEKEALQIACEQVEKLGLDMKMVDIEYTFDEQKIVFYFVSDNRIDFRELVKQLASIFKIRVELRQIGVRDHGKMVGGYGLCGRSLCCATWVSQFEPISIKHAKDQELALNPGRISGVCGRLKCCLRHEADVYRDIRQKLPKIGTIIASPYGEGKVIETHVIAEKVTLQIEENDEIKKVQVHINELSNPNGDMMAGDEQAATMIEYESEEDQIEQEDNSTQDSKLDKEQGRKSNDDITKKQRKGRSKRQNYKPQRRKHNQ